jgi:hypothetical protein
LLLDRRFHNGRQWAGFLRWLHGFAWRVLAGLLVSQLSQLRLELMDPRLQRVEALEKLNGTRLRPLLLGPQGRCSHGGQTDEGEELPVFRHAK